MPSHRIWVSSALPPRTKGRTLRSFWLVTPGRVPSTLSGSPWAAATRWMSWRLSRTRLTSFSRWTLLPRAFTFFSFSSRASARESRTAAARRESAPADLETDGDWAAGTVPDGEGRDALSAATLIGYGLAVGRIGLNLIDRYGIVYGFGSSGGGGKRHGSQAGEKREAEHQKFHPKPKL